MTRVKFAELTSGVGALVVGVGLGGLFATWVTPSARFITAVGALVHALGMWDKHRLEARTVGGGGIWVVALYWVCWLLLAAVAVYLIG